VIFIPTIEPGTADNLNPDCAVPYFLSRNDIMALLNLRRAEALPPARQVGPQLVRANELAQCPAPLAASAIFAKASSMVNEAAFWRGGKSLKVAANFAAIICAA
jgi:hypothetical protein